MNPLLEALLVKGLMLDAIGVIGLGLVGLAAVKLARKQKSWGGTMMASGAIALLAARLFFITEPHLITNDVLYAIGPVGIAAITGIPPLLLTFGLAGIVWGLWGHERWLREVTR